MVIELNCADGPMTGRFMAEGHGEAVPFAGWLELLALLESARHDGAGPKRADESI